MAGSARTLGLMLLLGANLLLAALAYSRYEQGTPATTESPVSAAVATRDKAFAPLPKPASPVLAQFTETLERPLFSADRRPMQAVEIAPPTAKPIAQHSAAQLTLLGVILTPDRSEALLRWNGSSEPQRLALNESINGWTLDEIGADYVVLLRGDERSKASLLRNAESRQAAGRAPARSTRSYGSQMYTRKRTQ
jgi:hypothetical protein